MPYNMIYYNELLILLQLDYFLENSKKYSKYRSMILQVYSKEEKAKKFGGGRKRVERQRGSWDRVYPQLFEESVSR